MQEYISRNIDKELIAWKDDSMRKPLLLRGARQVGKSSAVRHFGREFKYFAEVNFERHKARHNPSPLCLIATEKVSLFYYNLNSATVSKNRLLDSKLLL